MNPKNDFNCRLNDEAAKDPLMKERFLRESNLAITLTHENLVGMYGHDENANGTPFIIMDYLEGRSLEKILREEGLSEERFVSMFTQVMDGLSHAHMKGLIHRDIKPANIIVVETEPGVEVVKLIDFGIAKPTETSLRATHNLTQTGEVFGTPAYMSPEQCLGTEVDKRSDIYSLGCVMYEALFIYIMNHPIARLLVLAVTSGQLTWLYFAIQESSPKQGTLGERIMRLRVINTSGKTISFAQASLRHFSKILSWLLVFDCVRGYLRFSRTKNATRSLHEIMRQPAHDKISGCVVVDKEE
jgi:serine/threonine protein kinase